MKNQSKPPRSEEGEILACVVNTGGIGAETGGEDP